MARHRSGYITIDTAELLSEVSDDDLTEEFQSRKLQAIPDASDEREGFRDTCDQIREAFAKHDGLALEILILRLQTIAGVPRLTIPNPTKADLFETVPGGRG